VTNNIIFRIPTPVFGTGLMANIDDSTLLANHAAQAVFNRVGISVPSTQRQRWHHQPFWLEGAEQVADHFRR